MPDVKKVIHDLEQCLDDSIAAVVPADTVQEVITLLKAQEPVEPIRKQSKHGWFFHCQKCGTVLNDMAKPKYCSKCGQAVKWK